MLLNDTNSKLNGQNSQLENSKTHDICDLLAEHQKTQDSSLVLLPAL